MLYLGFLFNPISQVLICKGIQALRSCIYILGMFIFLWFSFLSTCYINIFCCELNYYCMFWGSNNQSWLLCDCCGSKASHDLGLVKAENNILDWRVTLFLLTSGPISFGGIWTSQYKDINQVHLFLSADAVRKKFLWSQLGVTAFRGTPECRNVLVCDLGIATHTISLPLVVGLSVLLLVYVMYLPSAGPIFSSACLDSRLRSLILLRCLAERSCAEGQ